METKSLILTADDHRKGPFWVCYSFFKDMKRKFDNLVYKNNNLGCPLFNPFQPHTNFNVSFMEMKNYLYLVNDSNRDQALALWSDIKNLITEELYPGITRLQLHVLLSAFFDGDKKLMVDLFYIKYDGTKKERTANQFFNFFAGKHIFVAFYKVFVNIIINYSLLL